MAIRITVWIQGLFSGFVTNGRHGKSLRDINLLLMLIHQMVALVRRALVEVCTVPVLLVYIFGRSITCKYNNNNNDRFTALCPGLPR